MRSVLVWMVLVLVNASCSPAVAPCTPQSCLNGCCSSTGQCEPGTTQQACGRGGLACSACLIGTSCTFGSCMSLGFGGGAAFGGGSFGGGSFGGGSIGGGSIGGGSIGGGSIGGGSIGGGSIGGGSIGGGSIGGGSVGGGSVGGGSIGGGDSGGGAGGSVGGGSVNGGGSMGGGAVGGGLVGGGCGVPSAGNPPLPRRCAPAATSECQGSVDSFLSQSGVPSQRLNASQGNGFDDDCDGLVDEGCACQGAGTTKDCWVVPATQASANGQPVGWCSTYARGTVDCGSTSTSTTWSGVCRGAARPLEADTCAAGDFNCDGLSANDPVNGCACGAPVECPTTPLQLAPYPSPSALPSIDGTAWIRDPAKRALAQSWSWTVIGGDCDDVLPFPSFALYSASSTSAGSRIGSRTSVRYDTNQGRYVASTAEPIMSIQANLAQGQVFPAFSLSGDYLVQGEFTLEGTRYVCTQRVEVRAPGIRAELCWNSSTTGTTGDLDLHFGRLQGTCSTPQGWNLLCLNGSAAQDCYYSATSGCRDNSVNGPGWGYTNSPPSSCIGWGSGRTANSTQGCTNPRLDRDTITCNRSPDPLVRDFCGPENINLDNPNDGDQFVVGVNYYSAPSTTVPLRPHVNVYCGGRRVLSSGVNPRTGQQWPLLTRPGSEESGDFWTVALLRATVSGGQTSCAVTPLPARFADPTRDGPSTDFCVDSQTNQTPAPNQFSAVSRRFIDNATGQGGASGTRPMQPTQWCKH